MVTGWCQHAGELSSSGTERPKLTMFEVDSSRSAGPSGSTVACRACRFFHTDSLSSPPLSSSCMTWCGIPRLLSLIETPLAHADDVVDVRNQGTRLWHGTQGGRLGGCTLRAFPQQPFLTAVPVTSEWQQRAVVPTTQLSFSHHVLNAATRATTRGFPVEIMPRPSTVGSGQGQTRSATRRREEIERVTAVYSPSRSAHLPASLAKQDLVVVLVEPERKLLA